ncbi:unnamed protein product, partial [Staurois parvus]
MWVDQRVNCVLFTMVGVSMFSTVSTLCIAVLCRAMQSSVQELTEERTVLFTYSSLLTVVMLLDHRV